jgi:hypothetical protein
MIAESLNIPKTVVLRTPKEDLGKRKLWARFVLHSLAPEKIELNLAIFKNSWILKMWQIGSLETSVRNYHYSLLNNPEGRSSHLLSGSLKSLMKAFIYDKNICFVFTKGLPWPFIYMYYIYVCVYIQGVPGGKDLTSGECSFGQTIPI